MSRLHRKPSRGHVARHAPYDNVHFPWRLVGIGLLTQFLVGCGSATTSILPVSPADAQQTLHACQHLFSAVPFEATHVVEASIPFSDDSSLIGVVAATPQDKSFRSVLLTQEGVVLFDAIRKDDSIHVVRALPPIDAEGFGRHMTDDVRMVLMRPSGRSPELGQTNEGKSICRWSSGNEQIEILLMGPRSARLTRYRDGAIVRRAALNAIGDDGVARDILLETTSLIGYQLHLILVSMERKDATKTGSQPSP